MNIVLRESNTSDLPFLKTILFEAVYWRQSDNTPTFEEGLQAPGVKNALADWGKRNTDVGVVASVNNTPVGAAWYRHYDDDNCIRGFIDEKIPVLVIGVHSDYRHQGIGKKMMKWLINYASNHAIDKISLSVSKDNYALGLYRQQGFKEYEDKGDWFVMVRSISLMNI